MKTKKCSECNCDSAYIYCGETRRNWFGILRWKYWCKKCYTENFCKMIESNPKLMVKYLNIHGKSPREILKPEQ